MKRMIRILVYLAGLATLSLGVVLNTKTGLGVSAINSVPYVVSELSGYSLGVATAVVYFICTGIQILLLRKDVKLRILLQIPFSILFGAYVNVFNSWLDFTAQGIFRQLLLLLVAIALTSLGAFVSVSMDIVPNAPDALAKVMGEKMGRDFGFGKNVLDILCVVVACAIALIVDGRIFGIGLGTIAAALLIGRGIKLWGKVLKTPVERISKW